MESQEVAVILLADLIAGKDDHILRVVAFDERYVLINCIGRALVPVGTSRLLVRRQDMDAAVEAIQIPGLSVPDILIEYHGLILGENAYCVNTRVDTV